MTDKEIIDLYWWRAEEAIPETDRVYGPYCHTVAFHLLRSREDAEESVNDTWLAAWNAMPPARPGSLKAFLGKLTRNIAVTRLRRQGSLKRGARPRGTGRLPALRLRPGKDCGAAGALPVPQPLSGGAAGAPARDLHRAVFLRPQHRGAGRTAAHEASGGKNRALSHPRPAAQRTGKGGECI